MHRMRKECEIKCVNTFRNERRKNVQDMQRNAALAVSSQMKKVFFSPDGDFGLPAPFSHGISSCSSFSSTQLVDNRHLRTQCSVTRPSPVNLFSQPPTQLPQLVSSPWYHYYLWDFHFFNHFLYASCIISLTYLMFGRILIVRVEVSSHFHKADPDDDDDDDHYFFSFLLYLLHHELLPRKKKCR